MPEQSAMDEVMDDVLPVVNAVPTREGEEKFSAAMELEHRLRQDAVIAELKAMVERMSNTGAGEIRAKYASSPSARRRQIAARKKVEELKKLTFKRGDRWEGPSAPATVINFNPVPLSLQGELQRWTVPAAGKGQRVELMFNGRTFVGSYMTINTPHIFPAHTGTVNDKQSGIDMPAVDYNYIPPLGLVHQFYEHFVEGASDAQYMGGVLIFEGDIHSIEKPTLERNGGSIFVPKKEITLEGFGDVVYTVEAQTLKDVLAKMFEQQRDYASAVIAEAVGYANSNSDIMRNQLGNYHRTWHNFALDLRYIDAALSWASETLKDTPLTEAVYCPDCRQKQTDPQQHFCTNCNAPFDALKSFLAGKMVSPDRLTVYEGEEWDAIEAEMKRRKAKLALLELPVTEPQKGKK